MFRILPLAFLAALAACGKPDPTPKADKAASAEAINASVEDAQVTAVDAKMNMAGAADTPEERAKVAKNVLGEANTAASTAAGSAAARQGRATVDPSAAAVDPSARDPLPAQPR